MQGHDKRTFGAEGRKLTAQQRLEQVRERPVMLIVIGVLLSLGWLALGLFYLWSFVGLESLTILPPYEVALIIIALIGPVALFWCVITTLKGAGREKQLERQVDALGIQLDLLRQRIPGGDLQAAPTAPKVDPVKTAPAPTKPDRIEPSPNGTANRPTAKQVTDAAAKNGETGTKAAPAPPPAPAKSAGNSMAPSKEPSLSSAPADSVAGAAAGSSTAGVPLEPAKTAGPRPSPLNDGLPPFKAGKNEPKDGELIYDILRRSVRDHLNDTAMDIAAVLSAREAYSEALTKLRQGSRGAFFRLVAKDLAEGGETARSRLDRLNAWPMLDSYSDDYGRLLEAAGGKDTKLGALIEKSELGQLGAAVGRFKAAGKAESSKDEPAEKRERAQGKS